MATEPPDQTSPNLGELGDTGLRRSYGFVLEEFLPQLQGRRAIETYREMGDNDPIVGSVLYALENLVRQVDWQVTGPNKRFVDDCRQDMSHTWEDFIAEACSKLQYGFSFHEIVYKQRDDGKIGWKKFPIRSQDSLWRWKLDSNGGVQGMWQSLIWAAPVKQTTVLIPIEKALLFRTQPRKNNPQGRSVLRTAYRPWWFKKRIEEIEAIGVERDLAGIPKIGVPAELLQSDADSNSKAALAAFKEIGTNLRNDEQSCVIYPLAYNEQGNELYKIELMSSAGRREFVTGDILSRYAQHIAMASLSDVILLGHEKVGSFALSESKEELLAVGLQAQVDEIAAVLNKHAIPRLLALNGIVEKNAKTEFVPGTLKATNMKDLAQIIWQLSMAGMPLFPSDGLSEWLRGQLDMPEADGSEMVANPNTGAKAQPGEGGKLPPEDSKSGNTTAQKPQAGDPTAEPPKVKAPKSGD